MHTTTTRPMTTHREIEILLPVSVVFVLSLLIIIAVVFFSVLIYKRRQSTSLSNLTKPHKESEENSYNSSEHGREFSSKQSDSPDPGYDVIKMGHLKEITLKSLQVDSSSKFVQSSKESPFNGEYLDGDPLYSTICSCDDNPNKVISSDINSPSGKQNKVESNLSADDNPFDNSYSETKEEIEGAELDDKTNEPHTYSVVHFKERDRQSEQENKMIPEANEAPSTLDQNHTYGSDDEAPSIPPHTVEMMYTAVQKRPKDSVEIEDEGVAPPIPPYIGEEYHTEGM